MEQSGKRIIEYSRTERPLWGMTVLLCLLCLSQYAGWQEANLLLTAGILLLTMAMPRLEDCVSALLMTVPMFNLMNLRVGSISLYYLMVFVFWFRWLLHSRGRIPPGKLLVLELFLLLRLTAVPSVSELTTWFVLFSVPVLTWNTEALDRRLSVNVFFLTLTFLISSAAGCWMLENGRSIYAHGQVWSAEGSTVRFAGLVGDSVFYAQFCGVLVAANLTLGICRRRYLGIGIGFSALLTGFCLLTYAKTGIVLCFGAIGVMLLWAIRQLGRNRRSLVFAVLLTLGILLGSAWTAGWIAANPTHTLVRNYGIRLSAEDLFTGRLALWGRYWEVIRESPRVLVMALPDSLFARIPGEHQLAYFSHNLYLETLCRFGLAATLGLLLWLILQGIRLLRRGRGMQLLPVGVLLVSGMVLHGHFEFHFYTLTALALSFLNGMSGAYSGGDGDGMEKTDN